MAQPPRLSSHEQERFCWLVKLENNPINPANNTGIDRIAAGSTGCFCGLVKLAHNPVYPAKNPVHPVYGSRRAYAIIRAARAWPCSSGHAPSSTH
jgi:hypothetical protein